MKKIFGFLVVSAFVFGATSCKKDYTCECVTTIGSVQTTTTHVIKDSKRKDAKKECDKGDTKILGTTVECSLKL